MSQRFDGVREANRGLGLLTPFILQKSRMRRRARTDLCGGRSARIVPTATRTAHCSSSFDEECFRKRFLDNRIAPEMIRKSAD